MQFVDQITTRIKNKIKITEIRKTNENAEITVYIKEITNEIEMKLVNDQLDPERNKEVLTSFFVREQDF